MIERFWAWYWAMFIACDCVLGTWIRGWYYVWIGGEKPNPRETISGWVGRRAKEGKRWALFVEPHIDRWFCDSHCREAAEREARIVRPD